MRYHYENCRTTDCSNAGSHPRCRGETAVKRVCCCVQSALTTHSISEQFKWTESMFGIIGMTVTETEIRRTKLSAYWPFNQTTAVVSVTEHCSRIYWWHGRSYTAPSLPSLWRLCKVEPITTINSIQHIHDVSDHSQRSLRCLVAAMPLAVTTDIMNIHDVIIGCATQLVPRDRLDASDSDYQCLDDRSGRCE